MIAVETFTEQELARLDERSARIVRYRQALDEKQRATRFKDIATNESLTTERVRQIFFSSIETLRKMRDAPKRVTGETGIEDLLISTRLANVCKDNRINRVRDLTRYTRQEFRELKNAGEKTTIEAENLLSKAGLQFRSSNGSGKLTF